MKRMLVVVVVLVSMLVPAVTPATGRPPAPAGAPDQPGAPLKLTVDATQAPRQLIRAREIIPTPPGPLTLHYPQWIPGEHGPPRPIVDHAGPDLTPAGRSLRGRPRRPAREAPPGPAPAGRRRGRERAPPRAPGGPPGPRAGFSPPPGGGRSRRPGPCSGPATTTTTRSC